MRERTGDAIRNERSDTATPPGARDGRAPGARPRTPAARFDADAASKALFTEAAEIRKRRYRPSRLDRHTHELTELRSRGHSATDLRRWLRREKRIHVALSTVTRWLHRRGL